jgi:hypothetical protein
MAIKGSGKVTITLDRTTVEKLREEKGGKAWEAFMLNLIEGTKQGVRARCVACREVVESTNIDTSLRILARSNGWKEISVRGRLNSIGFMCDKCSQGKR